MKPVRNPKSYQLIFLLCVHYKILERLFTPESSQLLNHCFLKSHLSMQKVNHGSNHSLLIQNIKDSFEAKKMTSAVFVDLTVAHDTVWHCGLSCNLLSLLLNNLMVNIIMKLIHNQSFTLTTSDSKQSSLHCLKNGIPQGLILVFLLFIIYMYNLLSMISRKFAYADDLALLYSSGNWRDLGGL